MAYSLHKATRVLRFVVDEEARNELDESSSDIFEESSENNETYSLHRATPVLRFVVDGEAQNEQTEDKGNQEGTSEKNKQKENTQVYPNVAFPIFCRAPTNIKRENHEVRRSIIPSKTLAQTAETRFQNENLELEKSSSEIFEETSDNNEVYSLHKAIALWRLVAVEQAQEDKRKEKDTPEKNKKKKSDQVPLNVSYTIFSHTQSEMESGNNEEHRSTMLSGTPLWRLEASKQPQEHEKKERGTPERNTKKRSDQVPLNVSYTIFSHTQSEMESGNNEEHRSTMLSGTPLWRLEASKQPQEDEKKEKATPEKNTIKKSDQVPLNVSYTIFSHTQSEMESGNNEEHRSTMLSGTPLWRLEASKQPQEHEKKERGTPERNTKKRSDQVPLNVSYTIFSHTQSEMESGNNEEHRSTMLSGTPLWRLEASKQPQEHEKKERGTPERNTKKRSDQVPLNVSYTIFSHTQSEMESGNNEEHRSTMLSGTPLWRLEASKQPQEDEKKEKATPEKNTIKKSDQVPLNVSYTIFSHTQSEMESGNNEEHRSTMLSGTPLWRLEASKQPQEDEKKEKATPEKNTIKKSDQVPLNVSYTIFSHTQSEMESGNNEEHRSTMLSGTPLWRLEASKQPQEHEKKEKGTPERYTKKRSDQVPLNVSYTIFSHTQSEMESGNNEERRSIMLSGTPLWRLEASKQPQEHENEEKGTPERNTKEKSDQVPLNVSYTIFGNAQSEMEPGNNVERRSIMTSGTPLWRLEASKQPQEHEMKEKGTPERNTKKRSDQVPLNVSYTIFSHTQSEMESGNNEERRSIMLSGTPLWRLEASKQPQENENKEKGTPERNTKEKSDQVPLNVSYTIFGNAQSEMESANNEERRSIMSSGTLLWCREASKQAQEDEKKESDTPEKNTKKKKDQLPLNVSYTIFGNAQSEMESGNNEERRSIMSSGTPLWRHEASKQAQEDEKKEKGTPERNTKEKSDQVPLNVSYTIFGNAQSEMESANNKERRSVMSSGTLLWRREASKQAQEDEKEESDTPEKNTKKKKDQLPLNVSYTIFGNAQSEMESGNNEERRSIMLSGTPLWRLEASKQPQEHEKEEKGTPERNTKEKSDQVPLNVSYTIFGNAQSEMEPGNNGERRSIMTSGTPLWRLEASKQVREDEKKERDTPEINTNKKKDQLPLNVSYTIFGNAQSEMESGNNEERRSIMSSGTLLWCREASKQAQEDEKKESDTPEKNTKKKKDQLPLNVSYTIFGNAQSEMESGNNEERRSIMLSGTPLWRLEASKQPQEHEKEENGTPERNTKEKSDQVPLNVSYTIFGNAQSEMEPGNNGERRSIMTSGTPLWRLEASKQAREDEKKEKDTPEINTNKTKDQLPLNVSYTIFGTAQSEMESGNNEERRSIMSSGTHLWRLEAREDEKKERETPEKNTEKNSYQVPRNVSYTVFGNAQSEMESGNNGERRYVMSSGTLARVLEDTRALRPITPPAGTGAVKKIPLQTAPAKKAHLRQAPLDSTMEAINKALYETTAEISLGRKNNAVNLNEEAQHSKAVKKVIKVSQGTQTIQEGKFGLVDRAVGGSKSQVIEVEGAAAVADTLQA